MKKKIGLLTEKDIRIMLWNLNVCDEKQILQLVADCGHKPKAWLFEDLSIELFVEPKIKPKVSDEVLTVMILTAREIEFAKFGNIDCSFFGGPSIEIQTVLKGLKLSGEQELLVERLWNTGKP